MRLIVFFDLPTETAADMRQYRLFRRFLLQEGFIMEQESVYSKLTLNASVTEAVKQHIYNNRPLDGLVQILTVTERQYTGIEYIVGSKQREVIDSDERLVVL